MSPVPDVIDEDIILNSISNPIELNGISSSDELDQTMFNEQIMDLGSLAVDSMDSRNLSEDDELPTPTENSIPQITTYSAPSTPTGERDPPVVFRKPSITTATTTTTMNTLNHSQIEVRYQGIRNSDNENGLIGTFFGCFKPFFSVMNKFSETIKYPTTILTKSIDDWEISIDNIINDLELIGSGNEGSVFRGKLNEQDFAFKRVKTKEETNIKHLKKLNHINIIKFRGISLASPSFYIIMEYCAYGSLYDLLKRRKENNSCTKPTQVLDWSKQISSGVEYLHSNKIVHRDLKSPNILFYDKNILKISDFGTSKELVNRRSQIMSFNGTSAWMAPEVIRQEPCSEKIDVWSFGIVLWEILTCAVPYNNIDPNAVMWGVGKGTLTLPIPLSIPEGFKLLMTMCWNQRPSNRPSFQQILKHLDISKNEIIFFEQEQEYLELTRIWSIEINEHLSKLPIIDISSTNEMTHNELIVKRQEELQHIVDIRTHYEKRLQQVNTLYIELKTLMMQLEQRENLIKQKEYLLNIKGKKRLINPILEARKKSLEIIKAATYNLNEPIQFLSKKKRQHTNKSTLNTHISSSSVVANNSQRRKKGPGHRRTNSKGSVTSWTPPSLTAIEDQEKRRASINITTNMMDDKKIETSFENIPIITISADIDSKSDINNHKLNPKNLKLDLENSNHQRSIIQYPLPPRKSSSSGQEDFDKTQHNLFTRQRRRRNLNSHLHKINSHDQQIDEYHSETNDFPKHSRNVTFQLSPSIINDRNNQRKTFKQINYTSSEEGEVEDIHSDDEKHRDKHYFSSESEIYGEKYFHVTSNHNDSLFSDEGGHISDDRPQSRESNLNSEPEHG